MISTRDDIEESSSRWLIFWTTVRNTSCSTSTIAINGPYACVKAPAIEAAILDSIDAWSRQDTTQELTEQGIGPTSRQLRVTDPRTRSRLGSLG
jgi:hypothetical protein